MNRFCALPSPNNQIVRQLMEEAEISEPFAKLCVQRGMQTAEDFYAFTQPDLYDIHDAFLLPNMQQAVDRIRLAIKNKEQILIYGDYDADGICSVAVLARYFRTVDARVTCYIPNRHTDGYGLNVQAVRANMHKETKLIITVDNGISAYHEIEEINALGIDVIVTDHHLCPPKLPNAFCIVNPHLPGCDYPFKSICGCAVATKLAVALGADIFDFLEFAAIATVADMMPITDENRIMVQYGLEIINNTPSVGVEALAMAANLDIGTITATHLGFVIAPRLNAAGRVDTAFTSLQLLLEQDEETVAQLADVLCDNNVLRKQQEDAVLAQAEEQLKTYDLVTNRAIVLHGQDWPEGVLGIAAARILEKYYRPVILFSGTEVLVGSARSIQGVHIQHAIQACSTLLTRYGGHELAAGLTLPAQNFELFCTALQEAIAFYNETLFEPVVLYDIAVQPKDLSVEFLDEMELLEPFGFGNPKPKFFVENVHMRSRPIGKQNQYMRVTLSFANGQWFNGVTFTHGYQELDSSTPYQCIFTAESNVWNGKRSLECRIVDFKKQQDLSNLIKNLPQADAFVDAIFTQMVYNNMYYVDNARLQEDAAETFVQSLLSQSGTLVLCSTYTGAQELLSALQHAALLQQTDVYLHTVNWAAIRTNTVLICPQWPQIDWNGWRRIVLYDGCIDSACIQIIKLKTSVPITVLSGAKHIKALLGNCLPDRSDYILVYRAMQQCQVEFSCEQVQLLVPATPKWLVNLSLNVFEELGFIKNTRSNQYTMQNVGFKDLSASKLHSCVQDIVKMVQQL